jgi:hypothetical protein
MRRRVYLTLGGLVVASSALAAACLLTHPLDGISDGMPISGNDTGAPDTWTADASADAPADVPLDVHCSDDANQCGGDCTPCPIFGLCTKDGDCITHHCAVDAGATCACPDDMAPVTDYNGKYYCVDSFEVTAAQYKVFLDACDGGCATSGIAAAPPQVGVGNCTAQSFDPDGGPNLPVVCVRWYDAFDYCAFRNKRLCGNYEYGGTPETGRIDYLRDEWLNACSRSGYWQYPFQQFLGPMQDPSVCNEAPDGGGGAPADVGSFSMCQGGFSYVYDMSGNAWEWENSCDVDGLCSVRGGSFTSGPSQLVCSVVRLLVPNLTDNDVGFRCCGGP